MPNITCYKCKLEIADSGHWDSPSFKNYKIPCENCCIKMREEELNKHVKKEIKRLEKKR